MRIYYYVGPAKIRAQAQQHPTGTSISSRRQLIEWLSEHPDDAIEGATFVVDADGRLRLAPRRSEHVACASGEPVRAAGEICFHSTGTAVGVTAVTNQSTGYCPEPESWPAVADALALLGIEAPAGYTTRFDFRRCETCSQVNIVKSDWPYCAVCDAELPEHWNLGNL